MVNRFGFGGSSSQAVVDAAVQAFRKFESLMMKLNAEEKAQVVEKAPVCDMTQMTQWGEW